MVYCFPIIFSLYKLRNFYMHTLPSKRCKAVNQKEPDKIFSHLHSLSIWRQASCIFVSKRSIKLSNVTRYSKFPATVDVPNPKWSLIKITQYCVCVKLTKTENPCHQSDYLWWLTANQSSMVQVLKTVADNYFIAQIFHFFLSCLPLSLILFWFDWLSI